MVCQHCPEVAKLLLDFGANVNIVYAEKNESPLYVACEMGHVEIATLLLENGADETVADFGGLTPKDVALRSGFGAIAELL